MISLSQPSIISHHPLGFFIFYFIAVNIFSHPFELSRDSMFKLLHVTRYRKSCGGNRSLHNDFNIISNEFRCQRSLPLELPRLKTNLKFLFEISLTSDNGPDIVFP